MDKSLHTLTDLTDLTPQWIVQCNRSFCVKLFLSGWTESVTDSTGQQVFQQHCTVQWIRQGGFLQDDGFYRVWMSVFSLNVLDSVTNEELEVGRKTHLCDFSWGPTWKLLGVFGGRT